MLATDHFLTRHRRTIAQAALFVYVLNPLLVTAQVIVNAGTANDGVMSECPQHFFAEFQPFFFKDQPVGAGC